MKSHGWRRHLQTGRDDREKSANGAGIAGAGPHSFIQKCGQIISRGLLSVDHRTRMGHVIVVEAERPEAHRPGHVETTDQQQGDCDPELTGHVKRARVVAQGDLRQVKHCQSSKSERGACREMERVRDSDVANAVIRGRGQLELGIHGSPLCALVRGLTATR
ncbi:hypothetical protein [Luteimonas sp. MHLX1A]|uniref:hypothetical protein n=1 Tax=Alterluteimonas muca TaxID=2878684 RepID=UPI001E3DFCC2|nr:hypothetical protein [Luteimonas sp. MHLX1A]MCD9045155.1 hypothetical protein [Luteimonas sp. MHLX1A]